MAKSATKDRAPADGEVSAMKDSKSDDAKRAADGGPLPESYESALAELDGLVARMESGSLSLEESLAAYRRGAALVRFCQQQLEKVEQQVRVLDGETLRPVPLNTTTGSSAQGGDDDL
jgi:exodeoxyribonuclease VII small subunit